MGAQWGVSRRRMGVVPVRRQVTDAGSALQTTPVGQTNATVCEILTEREVASLLTVSTSTISRLRKTGKIGYLPIGRGVRFLREHVEAFIRDHRTDAEI